jgi:hypothetical protein
MSSVQTTLERFGLVIRDMEKLTEYQHELVIEAKLPSQEWIHKTRAIVGRYQSLVDEDIDVITPHSHVAWKGYIDGVLNSVLRWLSHLNITVFSALLPAMSRITNVEQAPLLTFVSRLARHVLDNPEMSAVSAQLNSLTQKFPHLYDKVGEELMPLSRAAISDRLSALTKYNLFDDGLFEQFVLSRMNTLPVPYLFNRVYYNMIGTQPFNVPQNYIGETDHSFNSSYFHDGVLVVNTGAVTETVGVAVSTLDDSKTYTWWWAMNTTGALVPKNINMLDVPLFRDSRIDGILILTAHNFALEIVNAATGNGFKDFTPPPSSADTGGLPPMELLVQDSTGAQRGPIVTMNRPDAVPTGTVSFPAVRIYIGDEVLVRFRCTLAPIPNNEAIAMGWVWTMSTLSIYDYSDDYKMLSMIPAGNDAKNLVLQMSLSSLAPAVRLLRQYHTWLMGQSITQMPHLFQPLADGINTANGTISLVPLVQPEHLFQVTFWLTPAGVLHFLNMGNTAVRDYYRRWARTLLMMKSASLISVDFLHYMDDRMI